MSSIPTIAAWLLRMEDGDDDAVHVGLRLGRFAKRRALQLRLVELGDHAHVLRRASLGFQNFSTQVLSDLV